MSTSDGKTLNVEQNITEVGPGATVAGIVNRTEQSIERYIAGDYIAHQDLVQIFLLGPEAKQLFIAAVNQKEGLAAGGVRTALATRPPAATQEQLLEVERAQQATPDVPLTGESAYQFGLIAAYRRDYPGALAYFEAVPRDSDRFVAACEAVAWLQQSLANRDMQRHEYAAALEKLSHAKLALDRIEAPGVRTYELYGYVAKTQAQVADGQGDGAARDRHYSEATAYFERVLELEPDSAGAANGLGNVAYAAREYDRAIEAYQRAIELMPNYTAAYNDLGLAYVGKLQTDAENRAIWLEQAVATFHRAAELAVNDPGFAEDYPTRINNYTQRLIARYG